MNVRESRDSAEHPASNAIIISLDVTGSMGAVVRGIHADLPQLHELLLGHNYISDPQIIFAAVGDATCDQVPLQVGQFESDNRMDQNLENMILEGGGGGQKTESYELMLYVAARHTAIDCWEKTQRKGYLFMIGDEMAYPMASDRNRSDRHHRRPGIQADMSASTDHRRGAQAISSLLHHPRRRIPRRGPTASSSFWQQHLGPERVIRLDSPEDTSECIALTIGINEGAISMSDGVEQLQKRGVVSAPSTVSPKP